MTALVSTWTETAPIVLVDDSPEDAEAVRRTLRHLGVSAPMLHAADGDAALSVLRDLEQPPRMVILDLNLPDVRGIDLLGVIRHGPYADSPVAILTTSADPDDVEACRAAGADAYLVKPVGLDALRAKLDALLSDPDADHPLPFPY